MRFQAVHLAETNDPVTHLEAWQRPELLHHLFHSVYKESLFHRLDVAIRLERSRPRIRSVLEFGCGTAPVATTFFEFFRAARDLRLFLADIETIPFHYAAWKFAEFPNVHAVALRASNHFRLELDEPLDAIVCLGVLEHLDDPLGTTSRLHALLRRGGLLIFDYVPPREAGWIRRKEHVIGRAYFSSSRPTFVFSTAPWQQTRASP
jgi:SAM-dependent methyltransferase